MSRSNIAGPRIKFDRLPALAADLVRRKVAVIVAPEAPAQRLRPRRQPRRSPLSSCSATTRSGLVLSPASPGRAATLTGINFFVRSWRQSGLELLRELVPGATRVAVLVNPDSPMLRHGTMRGRGRRLLAPWGCKVQVLNASTSRRDRCGLRNASCDERPDALFVGTDPFFISRRVQIVALAARHAIPAIYACANSPKPAG